MVRHWRRGGKSGRRGKERRLKCVLEHADCLMLLQGRRLRVTGGRLFSWFPSSWCDVPSFSSSASTVSFDASAYEAVCCAAVAARAELWPESGASQNGSGGGNCVGEYGDTGPTQAVCFRRPPTDKLCQICHTSSVTSHLTARLWR